MKLTTSKEANINYLAKIVKLEDSNFSPHPNADRLKLINLCGNTITTSIDSKPGVYIYFPVECVIASEFLKFHNLYRDSTLNTDIEQKGLFEATGRVKCVKLRGIASEGFIMPILSLLRFIYPNNTNDVDIEKYINRSFDTVNEIKLVWKYSIKPKGINASSTNLKKTNNIESRIIEGQFRYHINTPKLQNEIFKVDPNDLIQISTKVHGTSSIFCNLLVKKKLNFFYRLFKKLGLPIIDSEYKVFCSSRKVIKDSELNTKLSSGYYDYDIWNLALQVVKNHLIAGQTIYAEIVGYMPTGSYIQDDYDYGCIYDPKLYDYKNMTAMQMYQAKLFDIVVYRITTTNIDGKVHEYSAKQVKDWCTENGLHHVHELYYGYTKNLFDLDTKTHWHENFIDKLRETYLEKRSVLCNNNVPEEGIVLRREVSNIDVYKLKANSFLQRESANLDKEIIDIESQQG